MSSVKPHLMITIQINGNDENIMTNMSLAELIVLKNIQPQSVAIVMNSDVVPRSRWPYVQCQASDKVELFSVVAGG